MDVGAGDEEEVVGRTIVVDVEALDSSSGEFAVPVGNVVDESFGRLVCGEVVVIRPTILSDTDGSVTDSTNVEEESGGSIASAKSSTEVAPSKDDVVSVRFNLSAQETTDPVRATANSTHTFPVAGAISG